MCGIAGFLGPWPESLLREMTASVSHRGPDGAGAVHDADAGLGLGHRRLSILDLSDAAAQPMRSRDGRYLLTYNGEIYNFRDLRRQLSGHGVEFRSSGDTEIVLELFARHGPACVDRLQGIFAFAIWDAVERRLFLARDHLGVKPLYYAHLPQGFVFASELKALTLCPELPRDIDPLAVADHVGFVWSAGEATMLRAVRKLRPGCRMTVDAAGVRIERYYRTPLSRPGERRESASPAALRDLIDRVVADQMVADVEVGALLSGGVDSSAIVAAMCRATEPERIVTFCATVGDSGAGDNFGDDLPYAREVARGLGVKLIEVPTEPDLVGELPGMVWSLDEPTADFAALQTHMIASEARRHGIKVLLSGVGGDDLFTGYGRHTAAMIYAALARFPGARLLASRLLSGFGWGFGVGSVRGRRAQRLGALMAMAEEPMLAEAMSFSAVIGPDRVALMAPELRGGLPADGCPEPIAASLAATRGLHPVERLLDLELNGFLPDLNLNYADKMAMATGVELRVPLVDPRLVAFAAALPLGDKIGLGRTKRILRASQAPRLPPGVLTRPKQGFGTPVRAWLRGPARHMLEELTSERTLAHRGLFDPARVAGLRRDFLDRRIDAALTLFPLMAVELWCRALDAAPIAATGAAVRNAG